MKPNHSCRPIYCSSQICLRPQSGTQGSVLPLLPQHLLSFWGGGGGGNGIWDQENSAQPPGGKERKHRGRTWQQVPRILSTSEKPAQVLDLPPALRFLSLHTSNICTPMGWLFLLQVSACVKGCPPLDTPSTLYVYISSLLLDYKPLEVQNQTSLTFTMPISSSLDHYI